MAPVSEACVIGINEAFTAVRRLRHKLKPIEKK